MQANAVARIDNLDFLADVIPKTTTYKQFKEKKARDDAAPASVPAALGQSTLPNGFGGGVPAGHIEEQPEGSSREESNGFSLTPKPPLSVNGSPMAHRMLNSSVHGHPPQLVQRDVEMEDEGTSC